MNATTDGQSKRGVGRPEAIIDWPDAPFTIHQLLAQTKFSKVTLYQKVNEAIQSNTIAKIGKQTVKQGRPRFIYKKVGVPTGVISSVADTNTTQVVLTDQAAVMPTPA